MTSMAEAPGSQKSNELPLLSLEQSLDLDSTSANKLYSQQTQDTPVGDTILYAKPRRGGVTATISL